MDSGRDAPTPLRRRGRQLRAWLSARFTRLNPVVIAVVVIAFLALALRLLWLGYRTAHWDEARVAYWILRYEETGALAYRPFIHGPFVHHVTRPLFAVFGPSDFVARLPVAIVGGLFPLSALLYREHLRDHETVLFALLLSLNAVLLYYSRFLRSDVLVAAFMITALGFLVRTYDTRCGRYLYPAALFLGFGIASKENALIYIVTWLGAAALLIDVGLFRPRTDPSGSAVVQKWFGVVRGRARSGTDLSPIAADVRNWARSVGSRLPGPIERSLVGVSNVLGSVVSTLKRALTAVRRALSLITSRLPGPVRAVGLALSWIVRRIVVLAASLLRGLPKHFVGAGTVLFVVWLFMFAPRGAAVEHLPVSAAEIGTVTFGDALRDPLQFPELVGNTWDYWYSEYPTWSDKALESGEDKGRWETLGKRYDKYAKDYFGLFTVYAFPTLLFGALGFVRERFVAVNSRHLVLFFTYAGVASVIGYPLGLDIFGPWNAIHPFVVLALPAAVGLGWVYRQGRTAATDRDPVTPALATLLLVVVFGHVVATSAGAVYVHDTNQVNNDLIQYAQPADDLRTDLQRIDRVAADNEGVDVLVYGSSFVDGGEGGNYRPGCMDWFDALPLPWYLHASGANVTCIESSSDLDTLEGDVPPIVITRERSLSDLKPYTQGYEYAVYRLRAFGTETAILFNESAIEHGS